MKLVVNKNMLFLNAWSYELQGRVIVLTKDGCPKKTLECPSKSFADAWFQIIYKLKGQISQNIEKHVNSAISKKLSANLSSVKRKETSLNEIFPKKKKVLTFGEGPTYIEFKAGSVEKELFKEKQEASGNNSNLRGSSDVCAIKEGDFGNLESRRSIFLGKQAILKETRFDSNYLENKGEGLKTNIFKPSEDKLSQFRGQIQKLFAEFRKNKAINLSVEIRTLLNHLLVFYKKGTTNSFGDLIETCCKELKHGYETLKLESIPEFAYKKHFEELTQFLSELIETELAEKVKGSDKVDAISKVLVELKQYLYYLTD